MCLHEEYGAQVFRIISREEIWRAGWEDENGILNRSGIIFLFRSRSSEGSGEQRIYIVIYQPKKEKDRVPDLS